MSKEQIAEEIAKTELRLSLRKDLPFLYGYKHYAWSRAFYESTNHICLLTAANQLGKSTAMIRKCINWATNQDLWSDLWTSTPNLFWYLYPSQAVVNAEFETKWKQYLPKGAYKDDEYYGWSEIKKGKDIIGIKFNSGITLSFKTYEQNVHVLQSSTVYALFVDEELPIELFNELMFRISATDGYFNAVFTATRGQEEWRRAMEPREGEEEWLQTAFKQTISLYDSMVYEDGSPSPWTLERIKQKEANCSTKNEVLKRIHGKFILDAGGRKYESFDAKRHFKEPHQGHICPKGWLVFCGVDIGSGGISGHPSAITYVAVKPDMTEGRVIAGWRGDQIVTTAGDVVQKYLELNKLYNIQPIRSFYDWASKDFYNIAVSMGLSFEKAEKSHERGEDTINTLFKNDLLYIYRTEELVKLGHELSVLRKDQDKKKAKDDFCFSGKTKIFTKNGDVPIKDVKIGDFVWTRNGLRPVIAKSVGLRYVIKVNETEVTWNHNYILKNTRKMAAEIQNDTGLVLTEKEKQRLLSSVALSTDDIQMEKTLHTENISRLAEIKKQEIFCTEMFTDYTLEKLKTAIIFTILMAMNVITELKILSTSVAATIYRSICRPNQEKNNHERVSTLQELRRQSGTAHQMVSLGTQKTEKKLGKIAKRIFIKFAKTVENRLILFLMKENFVKIHANQHTEEKWGSITSRNLVASVPQFLYPTSTQEQKPALENAQLSSDLNHKRLSLVYNITVQDDHEYFADNVLVANCDSFRYAVTLIPWNFANLAKKYEDEPYDENKGLTDEQIAHKNDQESRRRRSYQEDNGFFEDEDSTDAEFEELNEAYG